MYCGVKSALLELFKHLEKQFFVEITIMALRSVLVSEAQVDPPFPLGLSVIALVSDEVLELHWGYKTNNRTITNMVGIDEA